MIFCTES